MSSQVPHQLLPAGAEVNFGVGPPLGDVSTPRQAQSNELCIGHEVVEPRGRPERCRGGSEEGMPEGR